MTAMTPTGPMQDIMFEQYDSEGPMSTESFQAKADISDGVSGKHPIDTTFENVDYELLKGEYTPK
jgi:hypothetical protein